MDKQFYQGLRHGSSAVSERVPSGRGDEGRQAPRGPPLPAPQRRTPRPGHGEGPRRFGELHLATLMRAVNEQTTTLGVLFIDADHFKDVNNTFGHRTGDEVLHMVGQGLANGLRRGDIPVRWGGEEFLALLPGTDQAGLRATAERVRMLAENSWIQKVRPRHG